MHPVLFGVKRVHIEVVRSGNVILRFANLTPARYDLMRVLELHPYGIDQVTVCWLLGVTAPVVSRMLASLQKLGFIEREVDARDARRRVVKVTERGKIALGVAKNVLLANREAEHIVARGVLGRRADPDIFGDDDAIAQVIDDAHKAVAYLDSLLLTTRFSLHDRAPFHHPWQKPPFDWVTDFDRLAAARVHLHLLAPPPAPEARAQRESAQRAALSRR